MPRGVKKVVDINGEITKIDSQIEELNKQREKLLRKRREDAFAKLASFISENGITADEAIAYLAPAASTEVEVKEA